MLESTAFKEVEIKNLIILISTRRSPQSIQNINKYLKNKSENLAFLFHIICSHFKMGQYLLSLFHTKFILGFSYINVRRKMNT